LGHDLGVADKPTVKRYALVVHDSNNGMRRFHLARVATTSRPLPDAVRLERMEDVAARDAPDPSSPPDSRGQTP
jgi:hypothetical protein